MVEPPILAIGDGALGFRKVLAGLKDRDELLVFYDFWASTGGTFAPTNPIESIFATVRLRLRRTKGSGSRAACFAMSSNSFSQSAKQDVLQGVNSRTASN